MNARLLFALLLALSLLPGAPRAQQLPAAAGQNTQQARATLEAMVASLGGEAWLNQKNSMRQGRTAGFHNGKPTGGTALYWEFHAWPARDRVEYTKHRDVAQFYLDRSGFEVTYKGKQPMPKDLLDEFLRRRDHSIETVIHSWLPDPKTILLYEGQRLAGRHLAEQVTLISPANDSVTLLLDRQTHLPLRRSFEWRDPVYHDKNVDAEEYDDYHVIEGFPTAYSVTRYKNNEMTSQRFLSGASYNQNLPDEFWNPDAAAKKLKK